MDTKSIVFNTTRWLFGVFIFAMGIVNTFRGNDQGLGIGLLTLSFVYFQPLNVMIKKRTGLIIPWYAKLILGILLLWGTLGVGELFGKIDLIQIDF